jgi:4-amino-4-deoxy-L-arabinose transferase-like glycosyltransferase
LAVNTKHKGSRFGRWQYVTAAVLVGLFAFHTINNWKWVAANLTLMGWDRSSHLAKTLIYNDILQHIDLRSVFTALTWPWNRPPLPFLTAVPFYRLFGISTDVALMSNCAFLAILLCSVYGIGHILHNRKVGLLGAFLVSFYPVLFSISRLSYVDYALTAMVALGIYLVLKTDGFRSRNWSLLSGLGMGLGLLTKWPFIAFAGAPIAYIAWHSGALRNLLFVQWGGSEGLSRRRRLLTSPWVHALAALLLTALWYLPNWDRLSGFVLGYGVPLISWVLLSCTFYVLSRRPAPGSNLLSALMIGATLASAWSLPNIGFSGRFVFVAFGGINIQGKGLSFLDPTFYARYLSMMLTEQLSPLYFAALVGAVGLLLYNSLKGRSLREAWSKMGEGGWVLTLWLVVPFVIFTLSQTWNSRFDIALLPAAALITARGLLEIRARQVRVALISLLLICGVVQFYVLSYDSLYGISQETIVNLPVMGRLNLVGEGAYIMPPSTDRMDSGYWAAPEILREASQGVEGMGTLALLVNNTHLNADILRYLSLLEFPDVEVRDLGRDDGGSSIYIQMFAADYVVLSTHDPYKLSDGAKEAVLRVAEEPGVFEQVFELRAEYQFPDGEVVSLYGKRLPPVGEQVLDYYRHLSAGLESALTAGSAIVLDPPTEVAAFARFYEGSAPVYLLPSDQSAENTQVLEKIVRSHERVHAVLRTTDGGDPETFVERWLSENAYRTGEEWFGDVRLVTFAASAAQQEASLQSSLRADLGDEIALVGYELAGGTVEAGQILRLTLVWSATSLPADDYAVFVHLVGSEGRLIAQHDAQPVGGFRSTSTWNIGETVADKHGLLIPPDTQPGEYQLMAGLYLPATGERLPVQGEGDEMGSDNVLLATVRVVAPETGSNGNVDG